jgi:hypothetical protein
MKLRPLAIVFAVLVGLNLAWGSIDRARDRAAGSAFVDTPLVGPADLARARRIVVREKPRTKVVHSEEGFEVRRVVEDDAKIKETVLSRRGETWVVSSYFDLDADMDWVGRTMADLSQGRLTRFLTADPALMSDLGFDGSLIRLEDDKGTLLRQIELGRKDGGEAYQVVRIDGRDAFVAKHDADVLGDPLDWIVTRVFRATAADVQEVELEFLDPGEPPLSLHRPARGAPLQAGPGEAPLLAARAEAILAALLSEPVLVAVDHDHPAAVAAAAHPAARWRIALLDGRRYEVGYGIAPAGTPALTPDMKNEDVSVMTARAAGPDDLVARYLTRAALVYTRAGTLGRMPRSRSALAATRAAGTGTSR